jgi:hypothetical protein
VLIVNSHSIEEILLTQLVLVLGDEARSKEEKWLVQKLGKLCTPATMAIMLLTKLLHRFFHFGKTRLLGTRVANH